MRRAPRSSLRAVTVLAVFLSGLASPAFACEPDALWKEVRATCVDFVTAANAPVARVYDRLPPADRTLLEQLTREAMAACDALALDRAAALAARLAITVGRAEVTLGLPPAPSSAAALSPSPRT